MHQHITAITKYFIEIKVKIQYLKKGQLLPPCCLASWRVLRQTLGLLPCHK